MDVYVTYLLTYYMGQSPSLDASRFYTSQEFPRVSWNPNVCYHLHSCPPPVPILSQLDPVHNPTSHFLTILLNLILPSTPGSPKWSFPQVSQPKLCTHLSSPPYMLHVSPI